MSSIILPYSFLNQASDSFTTFATKRIEPIFDGVKHYANRVIFTIQGEYLPQGVDEDIPNVATKKIKDFLDYFTNFTNQNCTLTNVILQESNWLGRVPYEVECECYSFVGDDTYKTINASNEINVAENIDGTITISRNINVGAVSINNSNPVQDAKTFAQLLTGQTINWQLRFSTSDKNQTFQNIVLNTSSETADIFNGTYSIQQNFTANLLTKDLIKKGIVKQSLEIQSGIDGLCTMNKASTIIGGLNTNEDDLKLIGKLNDFVVPADYKSISNTTSYDDITRTLEVNTVFSNDKTITEKGNKVTNILSFNYDFFNKTYTANFNSEVRPAIIVKTVSDSKDDLSKLTLDQLKAYDPLGHAGFILEYSSSGTGIANQVANSTDSYISSPSIISDQKGIKYYDLSFNVDYQPGYPQNTFAPVLSGKGKYYLENLDFINNSVLNISINGKYVDNVPDKKFFEDYVKSGDLVSLTKTLILKDEIAINHKNKTFSYVQQKVGNDKTFEQIK